ncbi:MAG TPA: flavodoxin domain-containing protein [Streptosporangiaceae bacterium]|jgi:menaquinone-dependent protoporphyrinogen oxidase|nr:flavodoxin domain-containing protein [Streptosporangiaceae bacterium]
MRALITFGSKRGGTEGLARMIADDLRQDGLDVDVLSADRVGSLDGYDVVIVGGALYALRWHSDARRFVKRHVGLLRERPTYFFSSGPLDDSAVQRDIPPVKGVRALMAKVDARGHATFGGRLAPDAKGFPASAMAKKQSGDWRDPGQVRDWASTIVAQLRHHPSPAR